MLTTVNMQRTKRNNNQCYKSEDNLVDGHSKKKEIIEDEITKCPCTQAYIHNKLDVNIDI